MEIVEEKPYKYHFDCKCCQSKLIADSNDVHIGSFGASYGGESGERRYYVVCPVCETNNLLEDADVPPKVQNIARARGPRR